MDEELESDTQRKAKQFMSKLRQDYSDNDDEEEGDAIALEGKEEEDDESDIEDDLDGDQLSDTQQKAR
jgi:hypothetical protein